MRLADQVKECRSYTAEFDSWKQKWVIREHSWKPGYSAAHKATPEEAITYEIDKAQREQRVLDNTITKLRALKHDILKENN